MPRFYKQGLNHYFCGGNNIQEWVVFGEVVLCEEVNNTVHPFPVEALISEVAGDSDVGEDTYCGTVVTVFPEFIHYGPIEDEGFMGV